MTRLQGTLELATQSRWYGRPAEASGWPFPATRAGTQKSPSTTRPAGIDFYYWVIILGIILLIIGFIAQIAIVWTIGIIVVVVGAILALLGMMGHAVGGRRHYF